MNYGESIKEAREQLGLYQKDLSNEYLSRNLLSNIELGKTKLVPVKALIIYKKCLEVAIDKQLPFNLNFDALLQDNQEYRDLQEAYSMYDTLTSMLQTYNDNKSLAKTDIQNYISFAKEKNIGMLRYFILEICGDLYGIFDDKIPQCKAYFSALGYLKWHRPKVVIEYFRKCYLKVQMPAYKLGKIENLIHYLWILIDFQTEVYQEVNPNNYFNLGLFYKINGDFDQGTLYIDQYLSTAINLKKSTLIDCNILKASMLSEAGHCLDACNLYNHLLVTYTEDEFNYQKSICHSNTINCIVKNHVIDQNLRVSKSINELLILHDDVIDQTLSLNRLYSNIGQGYAYLENYSEAKLFFLKAYETIDLDPGHTNLVEFLTESYETYIALDDVDTLINNIIKIDYISISEKNRNAFMLLLLKLQMYLYNNDLYSQYKNHFFEYLNKIPSK